MTVPSLTDNAESGSNHTMQYLLGVDFGGTSSKATLLGADGRIYATAICEYPTHYPHNGWAEQDPQDSYEALVKNVRSILQSSKIHPDEIAALCLDSATHTAVLLDDKDQIVRNSIYWTDTRSASQAERLKREMGDEIIRECYNSVSSLWTLPQLLWLKENEPWVPARTRKLMSIKDYVRYRLTGDYVTDSIEAMGFMLLDVKNNRWSQKLCEIVGLRPEILPPIVGPMEKLSKLTSGAKDDTGLTDATVVIAGATDTAMEVYSAGAIHPGNATVKLATAGRICSITPAEVIDPRLVTYRHVIEDLWYPGTATKSCATSNRWFRDTFGGEYGEMSASASEVERGCQGLMFHPFLQGEITPYLDDRLRASFTGAAAFHTKAHFNRAVLEGVAFSMKDSFETLKELGIAPVEAVAIGGGMQSSLWRQIMCDMLNIPLKTIEHADSSLGSAMLAGVATGLFEDHVDAVNKCVRVTGYNEPNAEGVIFYNERFAIYKELVMALAPIYHKL